MAQGTPSSNGPGGTGGGETLKRLFSGFFLIPLIALIVLYAPVLYLALFVFLVTLVALVEYRKIVSAFVFTGSSGLISVVLGSVFPLFVYLYGAGTIPALLFAALVIVFTVSMTECSDLKEAASSVGANLLGIVYVAMPLGLSVDMKRLYDGGWWILFVLVVIWSSDTFAYYTGRTMGSRKLAPVISPGKTVEGAVAGLLGGVLAGAVFALVFSMDRQILVVVLMSFFIALAGIIGDLSESLIKRAAGVKDSGSVIPGHGGMLDRIDSLLFALPSAYFFLYWSG